MELTWSLIELYTAFDSDDFKKDMDKCSIEISKLHSWAQNELVNQDNAITKMEQYISSINRFFHTYSKLVNYAELSLSVNAKDTKALQALEKLEEMLAELTVPEVTFQKWLSSIKNLDELIYKSKLLIEHNFFFSEQVNKSKHMLSEKEEVIISKMKNTGSSAWTKLQELLTSTLLVDLEVDGEQKQLPLSAVRNLAYEKDPLIRKHAYEAELKAYKKVEASSAACLNGIKGEVITTSKMKGYASPMERTLIDSRMDSVTLDVMLSAIREALPVFHKYLKKKAEIIGHKNGLPFYDLFAPLGESERKYTYPEAMEFIVKNFSSFSTRLADFAQNAYTKRWIDVEPREGKRGGAFCSNIHAIKESRILTNFDGSFSDVTTLAHELGHGYHGECLQDETYLNSHYPMPIAETASIFCETIIKNAALKTATKEETFFILENDLSDSTQVVVDIYSRFLFESEVFRRRAEGSLSVGDLKDIMLKSQKEAYGDGLDPNNMHPYMWACKPHYYYADTNFYNFPYAFGLLFAKGLYAEYLKKGESFVKEYDKLLSVTGKNLIADVALIAGINIRSIDYWRGALKLIEKDIEKFIALA